MNEWSPVSKESAEQADKLTYEPAFHWHGVVNFMVYMTAFAVMFVTFRFLVGLI